MKSWKELGFEIETTGDRSPSLRLLQSSNPLHEKGESMHHSGGAMTETELIYGNVIKECFDHIEVPHFCVVGLGIGYIEMIIAREALLRKKDFRLTSYEVRSELREAFVRFLSGNDLSPEFLEVYQAVLNSVSLSQHEEIKNILKEHIQLGKVKLLEGLALNNLPDSKVHCISFDAYSAKTDPELWDEQFLVDFLKSVSAEQCWFSTYASRVSLKKALETANFKFETLPGFKGKRNSTRAIRQSIK
jgi:hypothetical protein